MLVRAQFLWSGTPAHWPGLETSDLLCAVQGNFLVVTPMSQRKPTPMTREAVSRIMSKESKTNGGKTPPKSFSTRVDSTLQKQEAAAKRKT